MTDYRITHPSRDTLEFRAVQSDEDATEAVANIATDIGVDRPPLVHVEARERTRDLQGRVTAPRRAANDSNTSDWEQALANYAVLLEGHVDDLQGSHDSTRFPGGYTFEDDVRDESLRAALTETAWTIFAGQPFELAFEASLTIGTSAMPNEDVDTNTANVDTGMDVMAKVGGEDLPGFRRMRVERSIGIEENALYDATSAEDNQIVPESSEEHRIIFEGTLTGTESTRATKDGTLNGLLDQDQVTFETRFPGYDLDGFVLNYDSNEAADFGPEMHQYSLTFVEGRPA